MLHFSSTYVLKLSQSLYSKRTKQLSLGLNDTLLRPHEHDIEAISRQRLHISMILEQEKRILIG